MATCLLVAVHVVWLPFAGCVVFRVGFIEPFPVSPLSQRKAPIAPPLGWLSTVVMEDLPSEPPDKDDRVVQKGRLG